jgi:hypothetical protein
MLDFYLTEGSLENEDGKEEEDAADAQKGH